jgi:hyperosmotically inducible protein
MTVRIPATLALALTLWLPLPSLAQSDADARLQADITRSLRSYTRLTIFDDIDVQVHDGLVTLAGKVTMEFKKDEIAGRIGVLDGVREVRNEIGVLPASAEDDALRTRVARAIYGSPAFHRYAAMPHPPIHILVEYGRVTLTGIVSTEVDRALARSLAAGQGERSLTCALRTDAERLRELPTSQPPTTNTPKWQV